MIGVGLSLPAVAVRRSAGRLFDFAAGQLPPGATFQRATTGSYFGADGVLRTAAVDVPRFDASPASGAFRGLLIEGAFTNIARRSNDFAQAAWTKQAPVTIEAKTSELQPNGQPADFARYTSSGGFYWWQSNVVTADQPYMVAAEFKPSGTTGLVRIHFHPNQFGAGMGSEVNYNIATGAVTLTGAGAASTLAAGVESLARGWFRLWGVRRTALTVTTQFSPIVWPINMPLNDGFWLGNVDYGIATGSQSQIFTATDAVARAADRLTLALPSTPSDLLYTFDDGSTHLQKLVSGNYEVPANLPRPHIRRIDARAAA